MEQRAVMETGKIDGTVIEACQRGDRDAFHLVFEAYKDRVYSIALYYFNGNAATASDVTQQVFLKLMTRMDQFRYDAKFTTWLHRLTVNACMDEHRKWRRWLPLADGMEMADNRSRTNRGAQEDRYAVTEIAESVRSAIGGLRPKLRIVVLLKYVEGLSYDEIASALNCSKGTVASRLNRGHKILARKLGHLKGELLARG